MAGPRDRDRGGRGGRSRDGGGRPRGGRRKKCEFCTSRINLVIDYKDTRMLRSYMDDRARIKKARSTGTCRRHQSRLAGAIKRSREMALIPYVAD